MCLFIGLTGAKAFLNSRLLCWLSLFCIILYAHKVEKQKLLFWEETRYSFPDYLKYTFLLVGVLLLSLIMVSFVFYALKLPRESSELNKILKLLDKNPVLLVFTCLTAGIVEELIFRGYLLPRLELLFKHKYASIIISSLLFGFLHYGYGTLINVIGAAVIGLVFALHYHKYRNIKMVILVHCAWDLVLLFLKTR